MKKSTELFVWFIMTTLVIIGLTFAYAGIAVWLWSIIIVPVFNAPVLSYWQMYGLILLVKLMFPLRFSSSGIKE